MGKPERWLLIAVGSIIVLVVAWVAFVILATHSGV